LRVLFREGRLVVLRVASVTLYDAGDADIFSFVEGECSKQTRMWRANGEWRFFVVVSKKTCLKKTLLVLPDVVFCASFAFFTRFVFSLFALFYTACGCLKKMFTTSLHLLSLTKHRPKDAKP